MFHIFLIASSVLLLFFVLAFSYQNTDIEQMTPLENWSHLVI